MDSFNELFHYNANPFFLSEEQEEEEKEKEEDINEFYDMIFIFNYHNMMKE